MTDHHAPGPLDDGPLDPADDLASAYLDGEVGAEDAARVEADPAMVARVDRLRAVRDHLDVDGPAAGLVDDHVAAALAVFDRPDLPDTDDAPAADGSATVTTLDADQRRSRRWTVPLGAAAAVLAVVALIGAFVGFDGSDGSDDLATADAPSSDALESTGGGSLDDSARSADDAAGDAAEESLGTFGADESGADGSAPLLPATGGDRLVFPSTDALADYVADPDRDTTATAPAGGDAPAESGGAGTDTGNGAGATADDGRFDPCDAVGVAGIDRALVDEILSVVVADRDVTAVVASGDDPSEPRRLVVVDDERCDVVSDRRL